MRLTEALHLIKHGFKEGEQEKYTHLDIKNDKLRKEIANLRKVKKSGEQRLLW